MQAKDETMTDKPRFRPFPDAEQDVRTWRGVPDTPQTQSPAYRLAFDDPDFLMREELRPVRLQLELLKTEMIMAEQQIASTVVMFGGARIPAPGVKGRTATLESLSTYYEQAQEFARQITRLSVERGNRELVICTGGGPGVMEAGNRGAAEAGGVSIGLNIVLPHEQAPNEWVTPELSFNFHYFAIRKMHFLMRARAITVFPGGVGTLDELFETLTLIQTRRMSPIPMLLFGRAFWERIINWEALADAGTISAEDLSLFHYVETADEAVKIITEWHETAPA